MRWRLYRYHCCPRTGAPMRGSLAGIGGADTQATALALMRWWRQHRPWSTLWDMPYRYIILKPGVAPWVEANPLRSMRTSDPLEGE